MDIKKNITIELSDLDLKEIIVEYLKQKGHNVCPKDIKFLYGSKLEGFGMNQHSVEHFEGARVTYTENV